MNAATALHVDAHGRIHCPNCPMIFPHRYALTGRIPGHPCTINEKDVK